MQTEQFSFSWQNVTVEALVKEETFWKSQVRKKIILNNVSGSAKSSSLVAIMGTSGAGKTTLLGAISGRVRSNKGSIKINNTVITNNCIKNLSGYVYQQNIFTENLTAVEHLRFMAALLLSNKTEEKRYITIKKLLRELGLENHGNTLIKNLSGGERRRLSLASELLNNPYILFCDEPTTGLDSYNAITVIQKLQSITQSGKIVLATIHQPSSQLFHYFNNIMLLAEGRVVFQGTKDAAKSFFESINLNCPSTYNPADFYIKCLNQEDISKICEIFRMCTNNEMKETCQHCDHFDNIFLDNIPKNNFFYELKWLMWRSTIEMRRNKSVYLRGYLIVMMEMIMLALFFSSVNLSDKDSVQNIQGVFSFLASELVYTNMYAVINVFPEEIVVFLREKHLYSCHPYFMSKIFLLVPLCTFNTITCMSIFFIMLNFFNGFYLWLKMTYLMFLVNMSASSIGLSFSATFSSVEHVDLLLGPLELMLLLLSGYFVKIDSVTHLFSWIKYTSPFYYGFDTLSVLFWRDITNFGNCTGNATIPCFKNGNEVLQSYGFYKNYDTVAYDILYLHILIAIFCLIGFAGLLRKTFLYSI